MRPRNLRQTLPLVLAAALFPAALLSCRYDPVPQSIIDGLGPETGEPGPEHRPGQPCLACHGSYAGTSPQMVFGGTVFTTSDKNEIIAASGVPVSVYDSAGTLKK